MKQIYLLLAFLIFSLPVLKAQDEIKEKEYLKNKIKVHPIPILINEEAFAYEHRFTKHSAVEFTYGHIYGAHTGDEVADYTMEIINHLWFYHGNELRLGYKFYFNTGAYLEPLYIYQHTCYNHLNVSHSDDFISYDESEYDNESDLILVFGKEFYPWKHFLIELYTGLGYGITTGATTDYAHYDYGVKTQDYNPPDITRINNPSFRFIMGLKIGVGL